ncbi:hypothetical protein ABH961_005679 [Bacillus sp. RC251]|uniref:hypothetical protein n=1 Tax=Bacillus sp. RC251 TaxID=3156290 RepID=UPI0038388242
MITKDITKNIKGLKINGEDISFSEASVRLIENTRKERISATESMDVIEWDWKVSATSYKENGFEMGVPVDVIAVTQKDNEVFKGKIILENMETEACSDLYKEALHFIGVSKLDGYNNGIKPSNNNGMPWWR